MSLYYWASRIVPTENPILGQEAAGGYLLQIRCSGYLLRQTIEKHEKSTLRTANKGVLSRREARIGTPVPGLELRRGLLRSGCASLEAVVQSANLRYGNHGSDCRRVDGPRFRWGLGQ